MAIQPAASEAATTDPVMGRDELRTILRKRWRPMLALAAGIWGLVILYTFTATPVYQAAAAISIRSGQPAGLSALTSVGPAAALLGGASTPAMAHQWLLLNPPLLKKAASDIGLNLDIRALQEAVRAEPIGDSLLVVYVQDTDPGRAADYANRLAQLHEEQVEGQERARTEDARDFIQKQLGKIRGSLDTSEEALRDYKRGRQIVDVAGQAQSTTQMLANLKAQAAAADAAAASHRSTVNYLRKRLAGQGENYIASSTISRNPVVQELETRLTKLESDRARESTARGPKHMRVQEYENEITAVKAQLADAVQEVVASQVKSTNPIWLQNATSLAGNEAAARAAEAEKAALQAIIDREWSKMSQLPDWEADLIKLQRETEIGSKAYADLIAQYYQTELQAISNDRLVTLAAPAEKPERAIRPRKIINLAVGLILAMVAAVVGAVTVEVLTDVFRSARDVQAALGLPVLAAIPNLRRGAPKVPGTLQAGPFIEAFRSLRTTLRFMNQDGARKVWLVTGTHAGEGKTTIAAHLAAAFAEHGAKTLLIDGDLRHPALAARFGLDNARGVTDVLAASSPADKCLQATSIAGLSALTAGPVVSNPVELLDGGRPARLLEPLRGQFETIIVDCSALPLADALLWAAACDSVLLVAEVGQTSRAAAQAALDQFAALGCQPLGCLANRV